MNLRGFIRWMNHEGPDDRADRLAVVRKAVTFVVHLLACVVVVAIVLLLVWATGFQPP